MGDIILLIKKSSNIHLFVIVIITLSHDQWFWDSLSTLTCSLKQNKCQNTVKSMPLIYLQKIDFGLEKPLILYNSINDTIHLSMIVGPVAMGPECMGLTIYWPSAAVHYKYKLYMYETHLHILYSIPLGLWLRNVPKKSSLGFDMIRSWARSCCITLIWCLNYSVQTRLALYVYTAKVILSFSWKYHAIVKMDSSCEIHSL